MSDIPEETAVLVAADTEAKRLASSLREYYRDNANVRIAVRAMGPSAVNTATKAIVELNRLLSSLGRYVFTVPAMEDVVVGQEPDGTPMTRTHTVLRLHMRVVGSS